MVHGVQVFGIDGPGFNEILTPEALTFLAALHRTFDHRRRTLLAKRILRQKDLDNGIFPDFLTETIHVRNSDWVGPSIPKDLEDRRVEITGPTDRKMVINALNSGAKVFMADFEDANCPSWTNGIEGQINLRDAIRGTILFEDKRRGKTYKLKQGIRLATLLVRPRGFHLNEAHILVDGEEMSGSFFDFGLYLFHNAKELVKKGSGPYFYLPKLESHLEARLWNDVFNFAQDYVGIPRGTCRATVLLETILAAFEMDEIIYELRDHSAGLNCGRWDYIFSMMKKFRNHPQFVFPDRGQVGMDRPFMDAYVRLLIKTCHRRKVHAMGGMSAFIPIKGDKAANDAVLQKVSKDKMNEAIAGHDGSWVAHPGLIKTAQDCYDKHMPTPNQIFKQTTDVVAAHELLDIGDKGTISEAGLRKNISVAMAYMEAWIRGVGCIPINNLMEDAATAEISRSQVWQWIKHGSMITGTNVKIDKSLVQRVTHEELERIKMSMGDSAFNSSKFGVAAGLLLKMLLKDELDEFLTLNCYPMITRYNSTL